jgi:hypothetical protein
LHIIDQSLQRITTVDPQPALAGISIGADDLEAATRSVLPDRVGLVFGGVLLVVGRHAHVFGRAAWAFDLNSIRAGLTLYHAHHPSAAV